MLVIREKRQKDLEEYKTMISQFHKYPDKEWTLGEIAGRNNKYMASKEGKKVFIAPVREPEDWLTQRRQILTLELPFQTDTMNVNRTLVDSCSSQSPKDYAKPYEWAKESFPYIEGRSDCSVSYDNLKKRDYMINVLCSKTWPNIKKVDFDSDGKLSESEATATFSDFGQDEIRKTFFDSIKALPHKESTKKIYTCYGRKMLEYCRHERKGANELVSMIGISAKMMSEYFDYLEVRCLRKRIVEAYKDLIGIRLLFYAPSQFRELEKITLKNIDALKGIVDVDDGCSFSVPVTFTELSSSIFSKNEPLLQRNTQQLNKFVAQTTNATRLKGVNPKRIRRSLPFICHQKQFYPDKLPPR